MELNALVGVYNLTTSLLRTTNGVLLGDFNADCQYLSNRRYTQLSLVNDDRFTWLLEEDTTTSDSTTCAYDRYSRSEKIVCNHTVLRDPCLYFKLSLSLFLPL